MSYSAFRRRLVSLLATTHWARIGPEEVERHAKGLGVAPEILQAARDVVDRERKKRGLKPIQGRKVNEATWPQLEIDMPEKVFDDWHTWCEMQQSTSNALLRGIIHAYLLGTWEPEWVSRHWRYKGSTLIVPRRGYEEKHRAAWPYRERVLVTTGAKRALIFRAARTNTTATAIVRGLMLEILEGRYGNVIPRDARSMFADVQRYTRHLNLEIGEVPEG